ncbi:ketopantoate reductase family protein [Alkalicoccus urumqiensis]|uniref:2-dehydropantoate 2-reductase n=1 Tax=Alkalicoccus urumqiensis TaxID=1548213 RepID=A0A2P6MEN1_ALKUR|nr:2-dehydropantoate 2-reductase [Alkalicoccus urumqiensis]PRO64738.1 hypothetical protein C6I21_12565 [Alkalicoccus urumqiensis]
MNITILGAGAVGILTGAYLSRAGHRIYMQTRTDEQASVIQQDGLRIGRERFKASAGRDLPLQEDAVIVTVKQYHLDDIINKPRDVPSLFLQNGMGHVEKIRKRWDNALFGIVSHGVYRTGPNAAEHSGAGKIIIGGGRKHILAQSLLAVDEPFSSEWTDDIDGEMRKKLLVNVVVNPLTVLYERKNHILLSDERANNEAQQLFREAAPVLGFSVADWSFVERMIELTRENRSSMLEDFLAGRELELEAITGYVINQAEEKKMDVSFLKEIHTQLLHKADERHE